MSCYDKNLPPKRLRFVGSGFLNKTYDNYLNSFANNGLFFSANDFFHPHNFCEVSPNFRRILNILQVTFHMQVKSTGHCATDK